MNGRPGERGRSKIARRLLAAGLTLVASGVAARTAPELFHPPAIWLSGIVLLLSVPFQICVLPEHPRGRVLRVRWVGSHLVAAPKASVGRYLATATPGVSLKASLRAIPVGGVRSGRRRA